jgi:hypothetical protein
LKWRKKRGCLKPSFAINKMVEIGEWMGAAVQAIIVMAIDARGGVNCRLVNGINLLLLG